MLGQSCNPKAQSPADKQQADKADVTALFGYPLTGEITEDITCNEHHEINTMDLDKNVRCAVLSDDAFPVVDRNCGDSRRSSLDECVYYYNDSNGRYE